MGGDQGAVDALFITLGLDPSQMQRGIQQVEAYLNAALGVARQFADGMQAGMEDGASGLQEVAGEAQAAGDALREAGAEGGAGMDDVAAKSHDAARAVRTVESEAHKLGKTLGGKLKRIMTGFVGPLVGMFAVGSLFRGYASGIAELDALTKKASLSMEERAKKQKLLALYSAKDLEQYRQSKKALEELKKKFEDGTRAIVRSVIPAFTWLLGKLGDLVDFVARHQSFFLAFFVAFAAVLSRQVIPAIYKMAAAWMANPMFWIIAAAIGIALALAAVIDDLWVYINGGKSQLSEFWAIFGTGEEIAGALSETWEDLKAIGTAMWEGLKTAASTFFGYFSGAIQPLVDTFRNALKTIKAIFTGDFDAAWEHFQNLWGSVGEFIMAIFSGAFGLVMDIVSAVGPQILSILMGVFDTLYTTVTGIFTGIGDFFTGIFNSILSNVVGFIKGIISKIPDFLLPEALAEWVKTVDDTVKDVAANMQVTTDSASGSSAESVSPAAGGPVDNSSETTINGGITVQTQATDANGIANDIGGAMERRLANTANNGGGN